MLPKLWIFISSVTRLLVLKSTLQKFKVEVKLSTLSYSLEDIYKVYTDSMQLSVYFLISVELVLFPEASEVLWPMCC